MHPVSSPCYKIAACIALLLGACSHAVESPKPALSKTKAVEPDLVCNAQIETAVVIKGSGFTPAAVPAGTTPGAYDVIMTDATSCSTVLARGLIVTDNQRIELSEIQPAIGQTTLAQAVTISRTGGDAFAPTPMLFLSPKGSDAPAVQLEGVSVVNDSTLTAVVPPQTPTGAYNLVVVDPKSGAVGVLDDAHVSTQDAPPVVNEV